jgi:hypothetical protein
MRTRRARPRGWSPLVSIAIVAWSAQLAPAEVIERARLVTPVCRESKAPPPPPPRLVREPMEPRPAWPWLAAGGGALGVGAGLAASGRERAAAVSAAVGAASLVAGVLLLVGEGHRPRGARPWLAPGMLGITYAADL